MTLQDKLWLGLCMVLFAIASGHMVVGTIAALVLR